MPHQLYDNTAHRRGQEPGDLASFSQPIDELVSRRPSWVTRNGTLIMLLILALLIAGSAFIAFPEVVKCRGMLTAINPPQAVVARMPGRINLLTVAENSSVLKGDMLGAIESPANWKRILAVEAYCDSLRQAILSGIADSTDIGPANFDVAELGEIQSDYQAFVSALIKYREYVGKGIALKKIEILRSDHTRLTVGLALLMQQKQIMQKDLALTTTTFEANEKLVKDKIISQQEFREMTSKLLNKQLTIPQIESSIVSLRTQVADKERVMAELESEVNAQRATFMATLQTMISRCHDWKAKYLFISPVAGKVHFARAAMLGQVLQQGATVMFVSPPDSRYVVSVSIPQANFGRVKAGQVALLKLPSYPWQEYGSLVGRLSRIADVPFDSSGYSARIDLPHGLRTKTAKQIPFREGLLADVEIITKEQNLLLKMYNSITRR